MDHTTGQDTASTLEAERQRLLAELLADEGLAASAAPAIPPRDRSTPTPLTFAQEVLWLLDRATPGLTAYNTPLARHVRGPLDLSALERALTRLVERHEALRTVFEARGESAVQRVLPTAPVTLDVHDLRGLPAGARANAAIVALRGVANTPFDLAREPGFRASVARTADDEHILLLLTHHIVSDAWSYGVIFKDLELLYDAETRAGAPVPPAPALQFGDYAAWQRATLAGDTLAESLQYWRERLEGLPVLELPTDRPRPATQGFAGARRTAVVSPATYAALRSLAQSSGATTYMLLLTAYATVLQRYSGQDDIIVGSAVAGRTRHEVESMVGYFSQALPMRVRFSGDPTIAELIARVSETVLGAFEHQDTPLESLVLDLQRGREQSHAPLFRVVLTMQDTLGAELRLGGATTSPVELDAAATKFDLTILATERSDGIELALWYRTDLFTASYAERFLGHMTTLLDAMVADPRQRVSRLSMLTDLERAQLDAWNNTAVDEGAPTTLVELFEAQAARVPSRAAIVAGTGGMTSAGLPGTVVLTYAELNSRANQLARHLRSLDLKPNQPVALGIDRSADALVGILGILKAGGCYVPLPRELPVLRRQQQLAESGAQIVVTTGGGDDQQSLNGVSIVSLDQDAVALGRHETSNLPAVAASDALAYVLYTSGSTGVPKGVMVTHDNAVHYARAVSRALADDASPQQGEAFAAFDGWQFGLAGTLAADLGNTSIFLALATGGTLHVLGTDVTTEPSRFADYVAVNPLDALKITPNHFTALAGGRRDADLAAILPRQLIVFGGEALRFDLARAVLDACRCRVVNHYGPTETTVGVLTHEVTRESCAEATALGAQTVPLGRPLANTHAYIVDGASNEQPVVIPGELLIGGAGVSTGYLNRPELAAERFGEFRGERVYRTGDRARRLADGTIEFFGRADDQVKVRGYRVELGEVEAALRSHPGIASVVAVLRTEGDDAQLVAYAVPRQGGYAMSHAERLTPESLAAWVTDRLPAYMVPSAVVLLDQLPLTANGKIDRAALPSPTGERIAQDGYAAPTTETETQLAAIWADVLKKERVGISDNFLALGGHSLLAIRVLGKISKTFGVRLALRTLFESPTVAQLARAIDEAVGRG
jgi:amino acid adenylation domain-containing protein